MEWHNKPLAGRKEFVSPKEKGFFSSAIHS